MTDIVLKAEKRNIIGKKVKKSRTQGLLPAVVYGKKHTATPLFINTKEFEKVYKHAGTSSLVDLHIDSEKPVKVIIQEPQVHYLSGKPIDAELYAVIMDEEIQTTIPIHFIGESYAVTDLEGNLVISKDELEVKCLPGDLVPFFEVDLSVLKTFEDSIRVSDITTSDKIEILHESEEVIASVSEPISEEQLEAELSDDTSAEAEAVAELDKDKTEEVAEDESKSE